MTAAALPSYRTAANDAGTSAATGDVFGFDAGSASRTATLELTLVTDRAAFNALEDEWNALFDRCASCTQLFQSYNWLWHWADHFLPAAGSADATQLAIVTGRQEGRLVLVMPFVTIRGKGLSRLTFMGDPVSQYGDVLADLDCVSEADLTVAFDFAVKQTRVDLVRLRKVRADAVIAPLLQRSGAVASEQNVAPYVDFSGAKDFAEYEQRWSGASRRNRRRQARRLQERGDMQIVRVPHGPEASDAASVAISLKRAWLKERGLVSPALTDPRTLAFFRAALGDTARPANCAIAMLKSNGEVAAIELTVTCKDRVAIHVIAYNLKFEKSGAGSVLMEDSIRNACDGKLRVFDLLAPGDEYKLGWADKTVAICDWAVPLTLTGRTYAKAYVGFLRPQIKRALSAMPSVVRRSISTSFAMLFVLSVAD